MDGTSYKFVIDKGTDKEVLHHTAVLGNPPRYCKLCKNDKFFKLNSNKDKEGNIYVNVRCKKCGADAKLGEYKVGGYFWHDFKKWEGSKASDDPAPNPDATEDESDDLPF